MYRRCTSKIQVEGKHSIPMESTQATCQTKTYSLIQEGPPVSSKQNNVYFFVISNRQLWRQFCVHDANSSKDVCLIMIMAVMTSSSCCSCAPYNNHHFHGSGGVGDGKRWRQIFTIKIKSKRRQQAGPK